MDHLRALAAAVADNPGDRHTRLVLADALEEAGLERPAELLRQPGVFQYNRRCLLWLTIDQHYVIIPPVCEPPVCQSAANCSGKKHWSTLRYFYPEHGWYCLCCALLEDFSPPAPYP